MTFRSTLTMLLAVAGTALAAPALAQDSPEIPEIAAEDVTTGQIVSFVNAMIALERIRFDYQPRIEAAETDDERKALAEEADAEAKAAVDKVAGISPEEYMAIGRAAQQDEGLAKRINTRIAELKERQQGRKSLQQPSSDDEPAEDGETTE